MRKEWTPTTESEIKRLKGMMRSCFAYDGLSKDNTYIAKYEDKLGSELFNKVYDEHEIYLNESFKVERSVYTDSEGCTYNRLIEV